MPRIDRMIARAAPLVAGALFGATIACVEDDPAEPTAIPYAVVPGTYTLEGTVTEGRTGTVHGSIVMQSVDTWGEFPCTAELTIEENGSPTVTVTAPCDGRVLQASELIFTLRPTGRSLTWRFFGGAILGSDFTGGEHVGEEAGVSWRGSWRLTRLANEAG